jgi:hypothetical protein
MNPSDECLAVAGAAAVQLAEGDDPEKAVFTVVGCGSPPCAAAGEHLAALLADLYCGEEGGLCIKADCSGVVAAGRNRVRAVEGDRPYAGYWVQHKHIHEFVKVKAHRDEEKVVGDADWQDFVGNARADELAKRAANWWGVDAGREEERKELLKTLPDLYILAARRLGLWPGLEQAVAEGVWVRCSAEETKRKKQLARRSGVGVRGQGSVHHEWVWVRGRRFTCIKCLMGSRVRPVGGCKPVSNGFLGWVRRVRDLGHVLVVTRGSEVPLLSYCKLCGKYAERTGQGLNEGCFGKPKNKNAKYKLKKMMEGKHPDGGGLLGDVVGRHFWAAVDAGVCGGGTVFRPKVGGLSWDAGVVQSVASDSSGNFLVCEPCGVGEVGGGEPCGVGTSGSGGPGPCGAGASGSGEAVPWEDVASGTGGDVLSGDEEVAALWWDCM